MVGGRAQDLTGARFGKLFVVRRAENDRWNNARWVCLCDCGAEAVVSASNLRRRPSPTRSCGCLRRQIIDLTGQRFGSLVCLDFEMRKVPDAKWANKQRAYWRCACDCGRITYVTATNLRKGNTTSCGCSRILPGSAAARRAVAYKYRSSARARGQLLDLDSEEFTRLISGACHYCGAGPSNILKGYGRKPFYYNGLDRKDNDVGYVTGNVVTCCRQCNFAKGSLGYDEFLAWIDRLVTFRSTFP